MADERDDKQFGEEEGESRGQQTRAEQREPNEFTRQQQDPGGMSSTQSPEGGAGTGQTPTGGATLSTDQGAGTTGQSGGFDPSSSTDRERGGSSDEGFIGSQGPDSDGQVEQSSGSSGSGQTTGSDFANQGRGALEEQDEDEADDGSTGGGPNEGGSEGFDSSGGRSF
jgi:hypothetical protein